MGEGAATLSADGVILYCNDRLATMLGRPLEQVIGQRARIAGYRPRTTRPLPRSSLRAHTGDRPQGDRPGDRWGHRDARVPVGFPLAPGRSRDGELPRAHGPDGAATPRARRRGGTVGPIHPRAGRRCHRGLRRRGSGHARQQDSPGVLRRQPDVGCPLPKRSPCRPDAARPFSVDSVLRGETLRDVDVTLDQDGRELAFLVNAGPLFQDGADPRLHRHLDRHHRTQAGGRRLAYERVPAVGSAAPRLGRKLVLGPGWPHDVVGRDVSRLRCLAGHLRSDRGEPGRPDPPRRPARDAGLDRRLPWRASSPPSSRSGSTRRTAPPAMCWVAVRWPPPPRVSRPTWPAPCRTSPRESRRKGRSTCKALR